MFVTPHFCWPGCCTCRTICPRCHGMGTVPMYHRPIYWHQPVPICPPAPGFTFTGDAHRDVNAALA